MDTCIVKGVVNPKHECRTEEIERTIEWISITYARLNASEQARLPRPSGGEACRTGGSLLIGGSVLISRRWAAPRAAGWRPVGVVTVELARPCHAVGDLFEFQDLSRTRTRILD